MDTVDARYEWRVWGGRLSEIEALMQSQSPCLGTRQSRETYLLCRTASGVNPKIRADELDVKVLIAVKNGYQQWSPRLKAPFPIDAAVVRDEFFPLLGLEPPGLERHRYPLAEFLAEVVGPHGMLQAVEVAKVRRAYTVAGCNAEVADVTLDGHPLQTASVESGDLEALDSARRAAGLVGLDNVSYPEKISAAVAAADDG